MRKLFSLLTFGLLVLGSLFASAEFKLPKALAELGDCDPRVVALHTNLFLQRAGGSFRITQCRLVEVGQARYARTIVQMDDRVSWTNFNNWFGNVERGDPNMDVRLCATEQNTQDPFQPPQEWPCQSSYTGNRDFPDRSEWRGWINDLVTPPTVNLTADPAEIEPGDDSTLTWSSQNANTLELDHDIGSVSVPGGSRLISNIQESITYTMTAVGYGGIGQDAATITVTCDSGSGGSGFLPRFFQRAQAQTQQCLPDLVPDLSEAQVVTTDLNGRVTTQQLPGIIGLEHLIGDSANVVIKNLKVKNIGNAVASGTIKYSVETGTLPFDAILGGEDEISLSLQNGQSQVIPELSLWNTEGSGERHATYLEQLIWEAISKEKNYFSLRLTLDIGKEMAELNECEDPYLPGCNNTETREIFSKWPAAKVTATSSTGKPVSNYQASFATAGVHLKSSEMADGKAIFQILPSPNVQPPPISRDLSFYLEHGGQRVTNEQSLTVTEAIIYQFSFVVEDLIVVRPRLYLDTAYADGDYPTLEEDLRKFEEGKYFGAGEGEVVLVSSDNREFRAPILQGAAIFSPRTHAGLPSTSLLLKSAISEYEFASGDPFGLNYEVSGDYHWPARDQANQPAPTFSIKSADASQDFTMYLPLTCENLVAHVELCAVGQESHDQNKLVINEHKDSFRKLISQLVSFSSYPLTGLKRILIGSTNTAGIMGYYYGQRQEDEVVVDVYNPFYGIESRASTLVHEVFHHADYYFSPSKNDWPERIFLSSRSDTYRNSLDTQFNTVAGKEAWDVLAWKSSYEASFLNRLKSSSRAIEAFAVQMQHACTYPEEFTTKLNQQSAWKGHILKRLRGFLGAAGKFEIPEFNAWYSQCTRKASPSR